MQVQLAADAAAELGAPAVAEVLLAAAAVLAVADDRVADRGHMGAELVGAAGHRVERDPGGAGRGGVDHRVVGGGALGALGGGDRVGGEDEHLLALAARAVAGRLDEAVADRAGARRGRAGDGSPVELAGGARLEGAGEGGGGAGAAGEQEHARGIAVEAVDEARLVGAAEPQRLGEAVDVAALAGAALDGEARRLVERDDVVVLLEHAARIIAASASEIASAPRRGGAASSGIGGTRTIWPASSRVAGFTRPPSTRISPLRHMRSMRPWLTCG